MSESSKSSTVLCLEPYFPSCLDAVARGPGSRDRCSSREGAVAAYPPVLSAASISLAAMTRATLACTVAMLALLSGCGDSGDDKASSAASSATSSEATTEPGTEAVGEKPVDAVRSYLGALDAGDAATFCGLMTAKFTKSSVADAVEHDTIRKGSSCADMVREFVKAAQFDDVDSSDATLKEISSDGTKAAVKVTYEDPTYSPYTLVLVKVDGRWLLDSER